MSIANTEKQILEELQQLPNEPDNKMQDAEELLNEIEGKKEPENEEADNEEVEASSDAQENVEENTEEDDNAEKDSDEEQDDTEVTDDLEEDPEDEKPGAKMRHRLKAEREAKERVQLELQQLRERLAHVEGRAESVVPQKDEAEDIPDKDFEPDKYALWKIDQLEKRNERIEANQTRLNAERQWESMQSDYVGSNPQYEKAKSFLLERESANIKRDFPSATDSQISQHLKEQEYITVGRAAKAGINPLQHIEFLAFQAGYRESEGETQKITTPKVKPNIAAIKKNAKKSASLIGGTPAGESSKNKSAEQLLKMSIDDIMTMGRGAYADAILKIEARG